MAIPGEKAIQMVRNAHAQAAQLDIAVTAVVVDQSGRMIALGRMDKARPITVEIALNKALHRGELPAADQGIGRRCRRKPGFKVWWCRAMAGSCRAAARCRSSKAATSSAPSPCRAAPTTRTKNAPKWRWRRIKAKKQARGDLTCRSDHLPAALSFMLKHGGQTCPKLKPPNQHKAPTAAPSFPTPYLGRSVHIVGKSRQRRHEPVAASEKPARRARQTAVQLVSQHGVQRSSDPGLGAEPFRRPQTFS